MTLLRNIVFPSGSFQHHELELLHAAFRFTVYPILPSGVNSVGGFTTSGLFSPNGPRGQSDRSILSRPSIDLVMVFLFDFTLFPLLTCKHFSSSGCSTSPFRHCRLPATGLAARSGLGWQQPWPPALNSPPCQPLRGCGAFRVSEDS